jgi:carboxymethylenebutenolidase
MSRDKLRAAAIRLYDRFTHGEIDRRSFMAQLTRLAGGAAAASALVGSIAASASAQPRVAESEAGLRTQTLTFELRPGRPLRAYNAAPLDAPGTLPVVVVVHENRGLNGHIRDVARRLAVAGYSALAPDFLSPQGGTPDDEDAAREMIGRMDMAEAVADGTALIRSLAEAPAGARRVGAVGFCWGGAMVNRLAVEAGRSLAAGVSFYGPAPDPAQAARVEAAMLVLLAGRDERVNRTGLPWIEALRAAGKGDGIVYPDVEHAFHNDTSEARYDRAAAEAAWAATLAHFARHLR